MPSASRERAKTLKRVATGSGFHHYCSSFDLDRRRGRCQCIDNKRMKISIVRSARPFAMSQLGRHESPGVVVQQYNEESVKTFFHLISVNWWVGFC